MSRIRTRLMHWALPVLVAATAIACQGPSASLERPLPFRVALIPVSVQDEEREEKAEGTAVQASARAEDEFYLDTREVTGAIVGALRERGFTDVHCLAYPKDEDAKKAITSKRTDEQFEHWMKEAAAAQADMLLEIKLVYKPSIDGSINEKFWLNLPLFLLGGPFCYFIDDRTYEATAKLNAQCYGVQPGARVKPNVFSLPLPVEFDGAQLDFIERAGKSYGSYALSLLVPAGLLARDTERIPDGIRREALDELSSALVERIAAQQESFEANARLAGFHVVTDQASARRLPDGKVSLSATVVRNGSQGLKSFEIRAVGQEGPLYVGDLSDQTGTQIPIAGTVDLPASQGLIQLQVEDDQFRRSYTFRIEPGS